MKQETTPAKKRTAPASDQLTGMGPRLRHLEKEVSKLEEGRSKIHDETYTALNHYEMKLNETQAILISRQDSIEKYVEDMKVLLEAKREFETQMKLLSERHVSLLRRFNQKEMAMAEEIKSLKKKFELIERNKSLRILLHKSGDQHEINYGEDDETTEECQLPSAETEEETAAINERDESSSSCNSNSSKSDNTPSDEKYKLKSFVNRLVVYPKRIFPRKKKEVPEVKTRMNGSLRRFTRLMIWWFNCKKRPTSNTKH